VLLVGPDGAGKSTLAKGLIEATRSHFSRVVHMHWRPGLLPRAGRFVGAKMGDPSAPHAEEPHGRLLSLGLLAYNWLDFFLGSWLRILPVRAKGGLVVMERGWMDIAVDPRRYHLDVPEKLVELFGRLLPGPDVVIVLQTDPEILAHRTGELPQEELSRQMALWRKISFSPRTHRLALDASDGKEQLMDRAARAILARL